MKKKATVQTGSVPDYYTAKNFAFLTYYYVSHIVRLLGKVHRQTKKIVRLYKGCLEFYVLS